MLICSHTSICQCIGPGKLPQGCPYGNPCSSPMDADLGQGAIFLPASFGASFLMQQNKLSLSTNNQFQHPHLAFLSLDAIYHFKGCVNCGKRKCRKGLHDQQRRFTKSHTLCTFPKKPRCVEGFRGIYTCLMAHFRLGFQIWPKASSLILNITSIKKMHRV